MHDPICFCLCYCFIGDKNNQDFDDADSEYTFVPYSGGYDNDFLASSNEYSLGLEIYPVCDDKSEFEKFMGKMLEYDSVRLSDIASLRNTSVSKLEASKIIDSDFSNGYGFAIVPDHFSKNNFVIIFVHANKYKLEWINHNGTVSDLMVKADRIKYSEISEEPHNVDDPVIQALRLNQFLGTLSDFWMTDDINMLDLQSYIYPVARDKKEFKQFMDKIHRHESLSLSDIALLQNMTLDELQASKKADVEFKVGYGFALIQNPEDRSQKAILFVCATGDKLGLSDVSGNMTYIIDEAACFEYASH